MRPILLVRIAAAVAAVGLCAFASAQERDVRKLMGIDEKLGGKIPADVPFLDETGKTVQIGDYLGKRPVLLLPIYYTCRTGCPLLIDGLIKTLARAAHPKAGLLRDNTARILRIGKDLDVVAVGINPEEGPQQAAIKKEFILSNLDDPDARDHLHLLTGTLDNIHRVTDSIGFRYVYRPKTHVIQHATGSVMLTPDGTISSYTIGNDFPTKPMTDSVALAASNRVGVRADQSQMFGCLSFDPEAAQTRNLIERTVAYSCGVFFLFVAAWILRLSFFGTSKPSSGSPLSGNPMSGPGGQATGA